MQSSVSGRANAIIADYFSDDVAISSITPTTDLYELGDRRDVYELLMLLEDELDIDLSDEVERLHTVGDLVEACEQAAGE